MLRLCSRKATISRCASMNLSGKPSVGNLIDFRIPSRLTRRPWPSCRQLGFILTIHTYVLLTPRRLYTRKPRTGEVHKYNPVAHCDCTNLHASSQTPCPKEPSGAYCMRRPASGSLSMAAGANSQNFVFCIVYRYQE